MYTATPPAPSRTRSTNVYCYPARSKKSEEHQCILLPRPLQEERGAPMIVLHVYKSTAPTIVVAKLFGFEVLKTASSPASRSQSSHDPKNVVLLFCIKSCQHCTSTCCPSDTHDESSRR